MNLKCTATIVASVVLAANTLPAAVRAGNYQRVEGAFSYGQAQKILKIVNNERRSHGLKALTMTKDLTDAAMKRAAEISVVFSHKRPNGLSCFSTFDHSGGGGENIAAGDETPEDVMRSWMNSSGHRAIMLSEDYTTIGIGVFLCDDVWRFYWVQEFGVLPGEREARTYDLFVTVDIGTASGVETIVDTGVDRSYVVRFLPNGGVGTMPEQPIPRGRNAKLAANAFTRKGWVFRGWATSPGGSVRYANKATVKNLAAKRKTVSLYAKWAKATYTVKFHANGGKGKMAVEQFTYGKAKKLFANKFKRKGYAFIGWATSKARAKRGKVTYKDKKKVKNLVTTGKTVKLYAVWKRL